MFGDMSQNLVENIKFNILKNLKTENLIIDSILSMLVICFITMSTGKILKIWECIEFPNLEEIKHYFSKPVSIKIKGSKIVETKWFNSRFDFSLRFQAILYKININLKNKKIHELVELQVKEDIKFIDGKKDVNIDFSYIISQSTPFELDEDIFCLVKRIYDDDNSDKKDKFIRESYEIKIFSFKKSVSELKDYLDQLTDDYEKEQIRKKEGKQYVLTFNGFNQENGGIIWNVSNFHTNRSFDNIFFENKNQVVKMITDFENNKEFYKNIGKPYHLGIFLYGEPGCGKTSFINALCNELGRSIKEIDFGKIKTINDFDMALNCCSYKNINIGYDKTILLFEDVDCATNILKSRKKIKENENKLTKEFLKNVKEEDIMKYLGKNSDDEITLSNILNLIDGIKEMPGRIMIFTSNYPEELDEAFMREGRIDIKINFKSCSQEIIKEMINNYYLKYEKCFGKKIEIDWDDYHIPDYKWKPCEIMNLLQKYGENVSLLMIHLVG